MSLFSFYHIYMHGYHVIYHYQLLAGLIAQLKNHITHIHFIIDQSRVFDSLEHNTLLDKLSGLLCRWQRKNIFNELAI